MVIADVMLGSGVSVGEMLLRDLGFPEFLVVVGRRRVREIAAPIGVRGDDAEVALGDVVGQHRIRKARKIAPGSSVGRDDLGRGARGGELGAKLVFDERRHLLGRPHAPLPVRFVVWFVLE